ncbi:MAG: cytochrome P450 [Cyanobacteria bacterium P01_E01_bin.6]
MHSLAKPQTPAFIQRLQWILDPVDYLEGTHTAFPDIFVGTGIGFGDRIIITSHPEAIQHLLTNDRKQFSAPGDLNLILEPLIGDSSLVTIDGDRHKKRRQLIMPSFHGERLGTYGATICTITQQAMSTVSVGTPFTARSITQKISLHVICDVVFGLSDGERAQQIRTLLTETADRFSSPLTSAMLFFKQLQQDWGAWSPWGYFLRLRAKLDDLIYAELRDRRAHSDPSRTDILSLLMAARYEDGTPMTDKELRDELMLMLFAGHETTATAMAWGLYWLHRCPEVKTRLLAELNTLGNNPNPMAIAQLPYLTAVCHETLRRSPVAMLTFPRVAQEPVEILGNQFPIDTVFMGCMYLTHQREDLYPNPREFRPERFLERKYSPYEFIPFGNGTRRCVGDALALFEMKLALSTILSQHSLQLADNRPEIPRRRGVTLAPARGVKLVRLGDRRQPSATSSPDVTHDLATLTET